MLDPLRLRLRKRDRYFHRRTAHFTQGDGEGAAEHHIESVEDVVQSDMRFVVVGRLKTGTVVLYDDLTCRIRLSCGDKT